MRKRNGVGWRTTFARSISLALGRRDALWHSLQPASIVAVCPGCAFDALQSFAVSFSGSGDPREPTVTDSPSMMLCPVTSVS